MEHFTDESSPAQEDSPVIHKLQQNDMSHIKGWGVDANPKNDPTYPMRQRTQDFHDYDWERPTQQNSNLEILQSTERPNLTAVYGTSTPPSGLSGRIRRLAFKYNESKIGHWLFLLIADRVNVVEGLVTDVAQGHVPNIFAESGIKAEWKHNPQAVVTKAVVGVAIVATIALILHRKHNNSMKSLNSEI